MFISRAKGLIYLSYHFTGFSKSLISVRLDLLENTWLERNFAKVANLKQAVTACIKTSDTDSSTYRFKP